MQRIVRFGFGAMVLATHLTVSTTLAQQLPQQCVQLPQRTKVCPNLLYKRAPIDVPALNVTTGEILCICMADFQSLRIKAQSDLAKVEQMVELSHVAVKLNIGEDELIQLIRN
ncbi:hypothetical protein [Aliiglaciecola sp. LCG003]|uniref:hypothetical protein n=1 Tax=Aliiglaciecola sp. LCG003 TaxID=3053655 RepID=UPI002573D925|nr:hypothetical protein [Aliiglaciecola sp. LCG003]WJG09729.1 hypothetical protein QR722_01435 [Aliiglaciecola sp. LCG003]